MPGGVGQSSFVCLPLLVLSGVAFAADALPSFEVNAERTSVSGLSSGAYMAGQFHVAFSGTVIGAGIVAGGPYGAPREAAFDFVTCERSTRSSPRTAP